MTPVPFLVAAVVAVFAADALPDPLSIVAGIVASLGSLACVQEAA